MKMWVSLTLHAISSTRSLLISPPSINLFYGRHPPGQRRRWKWSRRDWRRLWKRRRGWMRRNSSEPSSENSGQRMYKYWRPTLIHRLLQEKPSTATFFHGRTLFHDQQTLEVDELLGENPKLYIKGRKIAAERCSRQAPPSKGRGGRQGRSG